VSRFDRLLRSNQSWVWRYGLAVLVIALTLILSQWLTPHIGFPGTVFSVAVMLSAWFGGVGPGLLLALLSSLAFHYTFQHSPSPGHREMPRVIMFFISNALFALLCAAARSAKESLTRARDDLKRTVQDLQKTNAALLEESRERKQAEEGLRQAQADLARAHRASSMGELTASLAHEIKQPIAAAVMDARTCLRWLRRDVPDVAEASEAALRIARDVTRATDIISRLQSQFQKGNSNRELVDVNDVIRDIFSLLESEATRYNILVRTDLAADLPQVMSDRVQLQQVLMNLMINSIDATKNVDGTRELVIKSQRAENEQLQVSVSDTGIGLPPQEEDQIFNAFYTTKPHGTGMGLRISRSIIESHGGRLWATGASGRGATFQFTLPAPVTDHK
jgi:signal transduction histidine kinase